VSGSPVAIGEVGPHQRRGLRRVRRGDVVVVALHDHVLHEDGAGPLRADHPLGVDRPDGRGSLPWRRPWRRAGATSPPCRCSRPRVPNRRVVADDRRDGDGAEVLDVPPNIVPPVVAHM